MEANINEHPRRRRISAVTDDDNTDASNALGAAQPGNFKRGKILQLQTLDIRSWGIESLPGKCIVMITKNM